MDDSAGPNDVKGVVRKRDVQEVPLDEVEIGERLIMASDKVDGRGEVEPDDRAR